MNGDRALAPKRSNPDDYDINETGPGETKQTRYSDAAVSSGKSCKSTKEQNTSSSVHCACCLKQTTREEAVNYNNLEIPGEATTLLKAESISNQWSMPLMRETRR